MIVQARRAPIGAIVAAGAVLGAPVPSSQLRAQFPARAAAEHRGMLLTKLFDVLAVCVIYACFSCAVMIATRADSVILRAVHPVRHTATRQPLPDSGDGPTSMPCMRRWVERR